MGRTAVLGFPPTSLGRLPPVNKSLSIPRQCLVHCGTTAGAQTYQAKWSNEIGLRRPYCGLADETNGLWPRHAHGVSPARDSIEVRRAQIDQSRYRQPAGAAAKDKSPRGRNRSPLARGQVGG